MCIVEYDFEHNYIIAIITANKLEYLKQKKIKLSFANILSI